MKKLRTALKRVFCLNAPLTMLICVPSYILVGLVLNGVITDPFVTYCAYAASAYALIITLTLLHRAVKKYAAGFYKLPLIKKIMKTPFGARFFSSVSFRTQIFLYPGLAVNLIFCMIKFVSGILYDSAWLIFIAFYYIFLALIRFFLAVYFGKTKKRNQSIAEEYRLARKCGVFMMLMNIVLSVMMALIVTQNQGVEYPGYLIYVMALFAFYNITVASVNAAKSKKHGSPVVSAAKIISLTAAMVSMLFLETAMLTRFSTEGAVFRRYMTSVSSAVICTVVLVMAMYMIIHSTIQLNKDDSGTLQRENKS